VQDDPREGERQHELGDEHLARARDRSGRLMTADPADDETGQDGGDHLGARVGHAFPRAHPPAHEDGGADRGVEVPAGDVPAREDHHHQHCPDRERRQHTGSGMVGRHADREHEDEHPDELDDELAVERIGHSAPHSSGPVMRKSWTPSRIDLQAAARPDRSGSGSGYAFVTLTVAGS